MLLFKYDLYLFMRVFERNTIQELPCGGRFSRCLLRRSSFTFGYLKFHDLFVMHFMEYISFRLTGNILIIIASSMDALFLLNLKLILLLVNPLKCNF